MLDRVIHAVLNNRPAVFLYRPHDTVQAYQHNGVAWRETSPQDIIERGVILDPRIYARRWPGLKLPLFDLAA